MFALEYSAVRGSGRLSSINRALTSVQSAPWPYRPDKGFDGRRFLRNPAYSGSSPGRI